MATEETTIRIMYVHGTDMAYERHIIDTLKDLMGHQAEVLSVETPINTKEALLLLENMVSEYNIDITIGSELGAWYVQKLRGHKKIIINPMFHPSADLQNKVGTPLYSESRNSDNIELISPDLINEFKGYEVNQFDDINYFERFVTYGLFGEHSFNTSDKEYSANYYNCNYYDGNNTITDDAISDKLVPMIKKMYDDNYSDLYRSHEDIAVAADLIINLYLEKILPKLPKSSGIRYYYVVKSNVHINNKDYELQLEAYPDSTYEVKIIYTISDSNNSHDSYLIWKPIDVVLEKSNSIDLWEKAYEGIVRILDLWPTAMDIMLRDAELLNCSHFDADSKDSPQIVKLYKDCHVTIMGHQFHGINGIEQYLKREKENVGPYVVRSLVPFPKFDEFDELDDNRCYCNYLFCNSKEEYEKGKQAMEALRDERYNCFIGKTDLRPLIYYADDSDEMTLIY